MEIKPEIRRKPIRSYVICSGRMTEGQRAAYDRHWRQYGLNLADADADADIDAKIDFDEVFGRAAPLVVEIGFGMGDSLIEMCAQYPDKNFVGIEVHPPGVGRAMNNASRAGITNLRVFLADAKDVLSECFADGSLDRVQIYFPDPWHKKKHNKRRLIQLDLVKLVSQKLCSAGVLHMATDWEDYAVQMLEVANAEPTLKNESPDGGYSQRPNWRPTTKFEKRGERLGHGVWDLLFCKIC